jgi:hypothetical protein
MVLMRLEFGYFPKGRRHSWWRLGFCGTRHRYRVGVIVHYGLRGRLIGSSSTRLHQVRGAAQVRFTSARGVCGARVWLATFWDQSMTCADGTTYCRVCYATSQAFDVISSGVPRVRGYFLVLFVDLAASDSS